jgi:protein tyrosine phosphatase (PTP) superfamily phosphohydrolase (DUF442 family)
MVRGIARNQVYSYPALIVLFIFLAGCASHAVGPGDIVGPETWGASDNVTHVGNIYFSGQVDSDALHMARLQGITTVVNMRSSSEIDWDEKSAAENLGLEYLNIPIAKDSNTFDPETIARLENVLRERPNMKILMHCSSGNRVAAWYAIHLVQQKNMARDDALAIARRNGLTKDSMIARVQTYLDEQNL